MRRGKSKKKKGGGKGLVKVGFQLYPKPYKMPPTNTFLMQFRNLITITANGSGVVSGMLPCDPSATLAAPFASGAMFNEWTNVAALFSQIKCLQLECTFQSSSQDEVKGDSSIGMAIASNLTSISNFATSYLATMDNAESQSWPFIMDQSGIGRYHSMRHKRSLNWGGTATPASSAAIYAGCVGGIGIYCSTAINLQCATVMVVGTYLLSQRS